MTAALALPALVASPPPIVQGWKQVGELGAAFVLSAIVGVEREFRQKSAGMRTYTLVGVGAALFMLVSKYGFMDVLQSQRIVLDPSRIAAQIVSGIGFLGAGLIFVRRDSVRGLTTAAGVWLTAAIGAATGAGLLLLASLGTIIYLAIALLFPYVERRLPRSGTAPSVVRVRYPDGRGLLREILKVATDRGFSVNELSTENTGDRVIEVTMHVRGRGSIHDLASALSELERVEAVAADDANASSE